MLLNENGIRLPKNTKSAKILTHTDCDGFFSGLLLYNQLIRQGIKPERINVQFVQYGDYDLLDKATRKNKYQALLSSDFSAYPRVDMEACFNGIAKALDVKNNKFIYPNYKNNYDKFKSEVLMNNLKKPSFDKLTSWIRKNVGDSALLFAKPKDSTVRKYYNDFITGWKHYDGSSDNVIVTDIDYTSDHHVNDKGNLVPSKAGKIGATEYRSDTEHIATVAAQNLMNWDDIEIISRIDSAGYKNLFDTVTLPSFKTGDRKERLGIIVAALVNQIIKSNPRLAEQLIKKSSPSLISVYNNALKISKLNDNELQILSLLKDKKVDWKKVNELLDTLPTSEKRKIINDRSDNKNIKPVSSIETIRQKNDKNIESEKKLDTTDFTFYGNIAVFKAKNMRSQPSRYLFAFLESDSGEQPVFIIKNMPGIGLIQVAASPLVSKEQKEKIDLQEIGDAALEAANETGLLKDFAFDAIKEQSGGHKTIYNISGLNIISNTALSPNERYEYKDIKDYEARRKALNNKAVKKALNTKGSRFKELDSKRSGEGSNKNKIIDFLIDFLIKELKAKYGNLKVSSDFKIKIGK